MGFVIICLLMSGSAVGHDANVEPADQITFRTTAGSVMENVKLLYVWCISIM